VWIWWGGELLFKLQVQLSFAVIMGRRHDGGLVQGSALVFTEGLD
jgi:hypothetical protein